MQLRGVDLRSVGHSSPKLWPKIDFWKFPQLHPVLKTPTPGFWFPWCKWVNSYIVELRRHNSTRKYIVVFRILSLKIFHVLVKPPTVGLYTPIKWIIARLFTQPMLHEMLPRATWNLPRHISDLSDILQVWGWQACFTHQLVQAAYALTSVWWKRNNNTSTQVASWNTQGRRKQRSRFFTSLCKAYAGSGANIKWKKSMCKNSGSNLLREKGQI